MSHPGATRMCSVGRGSNMFLCQFCGGIVPPRTPAIRIVTSRRPKHPFRHRANVHHRPDSTDPGGAGWEIGREALSCQRYADPSQHDG